MTGLPANVLGNQDKLQFQFQLSAPAPVLCLEQNQSKYAVSKGERGGLFLRKKPLGGVLSKYGYSDFADGRLEAQC